MEVAVKLKDYLNIRNNLEILYAESEQQNHSLDEYIGRAIYEHERLVDPEERRDVEAFLFHLAMFYTLEKYNKYINLFSVYPEGVDIVSDLNRYKIVLSCTSLAEEEKVASKTDYENIISKISV